MKSPVNQKAKYKALNTRLVGYVKTIQDLYEALNSKVALAVSSSGYDGEKTFKFSEHPLANSAIKGILKEFRESIKTVIYSGTSKEWKNSNLVQDLLANKVLKKYGATIGNKKYQIYYEPNNDALKAFQERKISGMTLSENIWNQSLNYKQELEYAISSAIEKGTSAVTLSNRISKYLDDFPSLKKDYKDRFGKAVECYDCEYRSIRLARSEINMAYRTAEQKRWEQMDFVVGYEIKLSQSHESRMPHGDICDTLAGKYPKDFHWTGWHPNDMCYCIPILKTEDEFFDIDNEGSENEVTELPDSMREYLQENKEYFTSARERGTEPFWVKDNMELIKQSLSKSAFPSVACEAQDLIAISDSIELKSALKDTSKLSYHERTERMKENIINFFGENSTQGKFAKSYFDLGDNDERFKTIRKHYKNFFLHDMELQMESSMAHLKELSKADLSVIPPMWRKKYNELVTAINNHNFKEGYRPIVSEIEHAYNILRLSSSERARAFGLDKISDKTPYQIFTTLEELIPGFSKSVPKKEFFDSFDRFIPTYITKSDSCFYSDIAKHVIISVSDNRLIRFESEWNRTSIFYHEYGHAMKDINKLQNNKELVNLFEDWKTDVTANLDKYIDLVQGALDKYKRDTFEIASDLRNDFYEGKITQAEYLEEYEKRRTKLKYNVEEELGAFTDAVQAASKSHEFISPRGHTQSYFSKFDYQLEEFFAHCSELYWQGNRYYDDFAPDIAKSIRKFMKQLMKNGKP